MQLFTKLLCDIILTIVIPMQGDGERILRRQVQHIEQAEQHLGAGAVEVAQRNMHFYLGGGRIIAVR